MSQWGRWRGAAVLEWTVVVCCAGLLAVFLQLAGIPSAALFAGLVAGLGRALSVRRALVLAAGPATGAQAVVGVSIGALVSVPTLAAMLDDWPSIVSVALGTLLISLLAGWLMALQRGVSGVTGVFSMVAGGAAGITAMAQELGADERMVAVLQYLRVLLVVAAMPVVAAGVYGVDSGTGDVPTAGPDVWAGVLFTSASVGVGIPLGRLLRIPVASLLGPLLVSATALVSGLWHGAGVPPLLEAAAFLVVGLQVGLSFTRDSLAVIGRALPLALVLLVLVAVGCAALGAVLSQTAHVTPLTAYLATTPGGIYAVLATARDTGADATFVLAVQLLRLFVMLLSAPVISRLLRRAR